MDWGFSTLMSWLSNLGQLIYCTLVRWICWLLDFLFQMAWAVAKLTIPQLPSDAVASVQAVMQWYGAIDGWVSLDTALVIFGLYITTVFQLMTWRLLRRLSPF